MSKPKLEIVRGAALSAAAPEAASSLPMVDNPSAPPPSPLSADELAKRNGEDVSSVARHFFPKHAWRWVQDYGLWCSDCGIDGVIENLTTECIHPNQALCDSCLQRPAMVLIKGRGVCGSCADVGGEKELGASQGEWSRQDSSPSSLGSVNGVPFQPDGEDRNPTRPGFSDSPPTLTEEIYADESRDTWSSWTEVSRTYPQGQLGQLSEGIGE